MGISRLIVLDASNYKTITFVAGAVLIASLN